MQKTKHRAGKIDVYIGNRFPIARKMQNLNRQSLEHMVDVSHQQIYKYEHGTNRISATALFRFSTILQVPIEFFYEGLSQD